MNTDRACDSSAASAVPGTAAGPTPSSPSACEPPRPSAVTLSCADTYITLSRHPHYSEASDHLETWLGKLKTSVPRGEESRPAMEIEAASVMSVLKFFDRNFGRG